MARLTGRGPAGASKYGTLDDFVKAVEENPQVEWGQFLTWALRNKNLTARLEIANWMLDHGANPARVNTTENTNALHIMFFERTHDYWGEAKLLQRFLDGGIDINLRSPRWSVPLYVLVDNGGMLDEDLGPFYDVIFSHPGIDWDAEAMKVKGAVRTLRYYADYFVKFRPEFHRRMEEYLENGPSLRPNFS